jgi:hypothetical protein
MDSGTETFTSLFRIRKVFESDQFGLYKIEGALTSNNADSWARELTRIIQCIDRPAVFDCASLTNVNHEVTNILCNLIADKVYFLNLPMPARNMLRSAGLGAMVLD